ncbi:unnamed protein product [Symbiodinium natans]|uniref:Uncharacterized protein n=1 Tax=Symbiodinium natans TaxID=878477 RepID=A0A812IYI0_9DINO|nr:unnamed protein product [Symbiodinium natans]
MPSFFRWDGLCLWVVLTSPRWRGAASPPEVPVMMQTPSVSDWRKPSATKRENCPPGSSMSTQAGGCSCNFGFSGRLDWDASQGKYSGACTRTPCPNGTMTGKYAGECSCQPPHVGHIVWRRAESTDGKTAIGDAAFVGDCKLVPCPDGSSRAADWVDHQLRRPQCHCHAGKVGGFLWHPNINRYSGQCIDENPCAPGHAGARMVGFASPDAEKVRMLGKCERVACPQHADIDETGLCHCQPPYNGTRITWNATLLTYSGECSPDFHCPPHAVYQTVDLTIIKTRLACACRDGYAGGHMSWDAWGNRVWHGECRLVACPPGAQRHMDGLCHCHNSDHSSVTWDGLRGIYAGHCTQGHTTSKPKQTMEGKDAKRPSLREGSIGRDTGAHDRPKRHQSAISGGAHGSASENESLESLSSAAHLASAKHSVRSSKKDGGQEHEGNRGQHGQQTPGRHNKYAQKVPTKGAALFFHAFWHPIRTFAEPLLRFV